MKERKEKEKRINYLNWNFRSTRYFNLNSNEIFHAIVIVEHYSYTINKWHSDDSYEIDDECCK